jgi:hypothetical protein
MRSRAPATTYLIFALHDDRLDLVPVVPLASLRGFLRGMDPVLERDLDRI